MKGKVYIGIYDFETTDLFEPEPTQIGVVGASEDLECLTQNSEYIKPSGDISFPAMGITGITPEMVENASSADLILADISFYAPDDNTKYIASYNWDFDKRFIPESWLEGKKHICLLKLAKALVNKEDSGDHKLSTLWYYYGHYKTKEYGNAHDAKIDCLMTLDVLKSMLDENNLSLDEAWELIYNPNMCKFGKKYKGSAWIDIIKKDYDYVEYCLGEYEFDQDEHDLLEELLSEYIGVKLEQVKVCTKNKHFGKEWKTVIQEDLPYVRFLIDKGILKGDELDYVEGLLSW